MLCLFVNFFRLALLDDNDSPIPSGFVCHEHDIDQFSSSSDAANFREWLPSSIDNNNQCIDISQMDKETAGFILLHVAEYFRQLLEKERKLLKSKFLESNLKGMLLFCLFSFIKFIL